MDKQAKIRSFIDNKPVSDAVYEVLLESFLKEGAKDVHVMAAAYLAVNMLKQGWRALEGMGHREVEGGPKLKQVGM